MYIIIRMTSEKTAEFFGPFPTQERAREYAKSFWENIPYSITPVIVPNCVQVTVKY